MAVFLKLQTSSLSLGGLVKTQFAGPTSGFLVQKTWDGGKEFAFSARLGDADAANLGTALSEALL